MQTNQEHFTDTVNLENFYPKEEISLEVVQSGIREIAKYLSPSGTLYKDFKKFESLPGIKFWPEDMDELNKESHTLMNIVLLIAETSQLDPKECHPMRLKIVNRELFKATMMDRGLEEDFGKLGAILAELADQYLDKLPINVDEKVKKLSVSSKLKPASFKREDFLEACLFPLCLPSTMQFAFDFFLGHEIFINEFEFNDNKIVGAGDDEWGNLSSEPISFIHFIGTLPEKPSGRIIDWGCGSGGALFVLEKLLSNELLGFDKNSDAIRLANQNSRLLGAKNIEFYKDDIFNAEVEAGDTIYFFSPLRTKKAIKDFFASFKKRASGKPITVWSNEIIRFTKELEAQDWLKKGHSAGGITEYKSF